MIAILSENEQHRNDTVFEGATNRRGIRASIQAEKAGIVKSEHSLHL
jgi:hypothetical protein